MQVEHRGDENWHCVRNRSQVGGKESGIKSQDELVQIYWDWFSKCASREPKVQGKDWTREKKRDNLGLIFTINLLLPNHLSASRAMVILRRRS